MMKSLKIHILMLLILPGFLTANKCFAQKRGNESRMFLKYEMPITEFYEHQPVPVSVVLCSTTPDIAEVREVEDVSLKKGSFATLQTVDNPGSAYVKNVGGERVYCFPLKTIMVSMAEKGTYTLTGAAYEVGVPVYSVVNHPYRGPVRTVDIETVKLTPDNKSFKVRSLPIASDSSEFSGSVGKFKIKTVIPPGDIFVNEEATAIIILQGTGLIAEQTMPEYRDAFGNGVKLKSVSESRSGAYKNGDMLSELRLECTFVPFRQDDVTIGEVSFNYFDPEKKEYKKAVSKPVTIKVKSITSRKEAITI
ncbi:MAG: BatD family protein [Candidatus Amulumruptor caecigallinarius]|nr:BatD family protein [Candidatus Amulumruptor caecigallinarius]